MPLPVSDDPWLDPWLDAAHKAWPQHAPPLKRSQVGAQGWSVAAGDLPLPVALIRQAALQHNIGWLQRFAEDRGLGLAPHGKTTMSPQLFQRQLEGGAWGITVATVGQLRVALQAGAERALIANQVLAAADLAALATLLAGRPGRRAPFLLDSLAQLQAVAAMRPATPFEVLLEVGVPGGRTGCRGHEEALALARAAHASPAVRLAGIECYEGLGVTGNDDEDRARTAALTERFSAIARQCDAEALFDTPEILLSAGGSGLFDLVAPALQLRLGKPVQGLLRSGCYITHDQGSYRRLLARVEHRSGCASSLQAAMEVWALVQSLPEPGLAIVAAGRRDISFDMGLPTVIGHLRPGDTRPGPVHDSWTITGLNDQHAHLRGDTRDLRVGDRLVLGLSHPCTTFDKWRWMPVVDEDYRVVDAITTCF